MQLTAKLSVTSPRIGKLSLVGWTSKITPRQRTIDCAIKMANKSIVKMLRLAAKVGLSTPLSRRQNWSQQCSILTSLPTHSILQKITLYNHRPPAFLNCHSSFSVLFHPNSEIPLFGFDKPCISLTPRLNDHDPFIQRYPWTNRMVVLTISENSRLTRKINLLWVTDGPWWVKESRIQWQTETW